MVEYVGISEDFVLVCLGVGFFFIKFGFDFIDLLVDRGGFFIEVSKMSDIFVCFFFVVYVVGEVGGFGKEEDINIEDEWLKEW